MLDWFRLSGINWTMVKYIELYRTALDYTWLYKTISDYIVYSTIPELIELYLTIQDMDYNRQYQAILDSNIY